MELLLNIRVNPQNSSIIVLNEIELGKKVKDLKVTTAEKANLCVDSFELVFCGCVLKDNSTLELCGLKNGSMVQVLKKPSDRTIKSHIYPDTHASQLSAIFKAVNENPVLRSALQRLSKKPDVIENILASAPKLKNDSVAVAILQDPDLMSHFADSKTIKKIFKMHPALAEALLHIATAVHEEAHNTGAGSSSTSNGHTTGFSYSLDSLSDDEEMTGDSSQVSDSNQPGVIPRNQPNSTITTEQLASALSQAREFSLSNSSQPSAPAESSGSGIITTEMFTHAIRQAFAAAPPSTLSPLGGNIGIPPIDPQIPDMQTQLALMHEVGLENDVINVQALQFTNNDVQAAIDLVLRGYIF